jgi:hypothetical protein
MRPILKLQGAVQQRPDRGLQDGFRCSKMPSLDQLGYFRCEHFGSFPLR